MKAEVSVESPVSLSEIRRRFSTGKCCLCSTNLIKHKGAVLLLMWSFLGLSVFQYFVVSNSRDPIKKRTKFSSSELLAIGLLLPISGWLADAYLGRYKVICYGMWTMWLGAMLNGFSLLIGMVVESYRDHSDPWVSFVCRIMMGAGLAAFQANLFLFGIDQLIDASSAEIKSYISWYIITIFGCNVTLCVTTFCTHEYVAVLAVTVCLTLAVISNYFLNTWLIKEQITENMLPLILKVVHFTVKSKCQKKKICLERQGILSNFNVAKSVYNGPFNSEQVEDVKTLFRVMLVIVAFIIASCGEPSVDNMYDLTISPLEGSLSQRCFLAVSLKYSNTLFGVVAVLVYQVFIDPFVHNFVCKVSIRNRFIISLVLFFACVVALLSIESASYIHQAHVNQTITQCVFQSIHNERNGVYWSLIPKLFNGLSQVLFLFSGIEFICAQAPFNMKGLVIGLAYAFYGLCSLIQAAIKRLFIYSHIWKNAPLSCGIWYFMMQTLIVLICFVVTAVVIKTYKERTRVNIISRSDWQESDSYAE